MTDPNQTNNSSMDSNFAQKQNLNQQNYNNQQGFNQQSNFNQQGFNQQSNFNQQGFNQQMIKQNTFTAWSQHKVVKRSTYIFLTWFLGFFGIHKFYAGNTFWGIIYIVIAIVGTPLMGLGVVALIVLIIIDLVSACKAPDVAPNNGYCII